MIFATVLTIGYILYYATIITFDLRAKSKTDAAKEEVISVADAADTNNNQVEEYAPKSVVENAETGGFSFVDSVPQEESQQEKIEEAEEEKVAETVDTPQGNEGNNADEVETGEPVSEPTTDGENQPTEEAEAVTDQEAAGNGDAAPEEEQANDEQQAEDNQSDDDDDLPNLSTINYVEQQEQEQQPEEPFDESKVFDPELSQPKYGVTIFEPQSSNEVIAHANDVNEALLSIATKSNNSYDVFDFDSLLRDKALAESKNIETRDEVTRY